MIIKNNYIKIPIYSVVECCSSNGSGRMLVRCIVIRTGFLPNPVCSIGNKFWCSPPGWLWLALGSTERVLLISSVVARKHLCARKDNRHVCCAFNSNLSETTLLPPLLSPLSKYPCSFAKKRCECDSKSCQHTLFLDMFSEVRWIDSRN